jgi:bacterioferritin-associated ferredoxin
VARGYNAFMPLQPDDTVCFCFHVSLRKIETFCKTEKPQHASQISDCLSAGSGCGWCRPALEQLHKQFCGNQTPWWREGEPQPSPPAPSIPESADAEARKAARREYIARHKVKPPPGAEI